MGSLSFGEDPLPGDNEAGDKEATGGDVSLDGELVLVRTHDDVWAFACDVDQPLQWFGEPWSTGSDHLPLVTSA